VGLVRLVERLGGAGSRNREVVAHGDEENRKDRKAGGRKAAGLRRLRPALQGRDALKRTPTTFLPSQIEPMISLERLKFEVPDRGGLAPISKYAHLIVPGGGYRVWDLRRLAGGASIFAGIARLCRL